VGGEKTLILAGHHGDDGASKWAATKDISLGLIWHITIRDLPPSRRRGFALVHTLLHLVFRLLIVFLPGRFDGLSCPVLRRKGTFEHREHNEMCLIQIATKLRRNPKRSEGAIRVGQKEGIIDAADHTSM
jgi:hypothetical protein